MAQSCCQTKTLSRIPAGAELDGNGNTSLNCWRAGAGDWAGVGSGLVTDRVEWQSLRAHNGFASRRREGGEAVFPPSSSGRWPLPAESGCPGARFPCTPEPQVEANMTRRRVGLWLVGAFGGVGTTITLGLAAMSRGLADSTGLVTALPPFRNLPLPEPSDFVVGGHEIRSTTFAESAEEFRRTSGVFDPAWITTCRAELDAASARVRPAPRLGLARWSSGLADWQDSRTARTARQAVDAIATDLGAFIAGESIDHLIVLNVGSTEPPFPLADVHQHWKSLEPRLHDAGKVLPSSALYALAAVEGGHSYINFTPSLGGSIPAIHELAMATGALSRRQGRQDWRDPDENRAGPDVRAPQPEGRELGRTQYLRQPRRPGARRSRPARARRSRPRTG